ncbi:MAG: ATP-binding protein [Gemmatimonadaceae bacterium]
MSKPTAGSDPSTDHPDGEAHGTPRAPSSGMYERIIEAAADAIITIDDAEDIVQFNRGAEQIFGYPKSEVLGRKLDCLLPAKFRASHAGHVAAFGRSAETARLMGHRSEVFGQRKDGTTFPAEASILKLDAPDGRRLYTALVRDVSDRNRMELQQRFLADVSAALSKSLDYEATLASVVRLPVPALADACVLEVLDDEGQTMRITFQRPDITDGSGGLVSAADVVSLLARGESVGTLTLLRFGSSEKFDSADRVIAENFGARAALAIDNARLYNESRRATRLRDEVLGVVSHDLRNPLSAIAMCARVLLEKPPAEADVRSELAKTIYDSTAWMSRMIQDLLDVSAIDAGALSIVLSTVEIAAIFSHVAELLTHVAVERGVELKFTIEESLPAVDADAARLVQAIANLVGNAVKFTESGGRVGVLAHMRFDDIEIVVEDTGRGIDGESLPHVFDRYWHSRGNGSGTGLGLAIAKGIVEAHGGHIRVTSTPQVGSRFSILLPRAMVLA